ncbi:MAG: hypothetical protein ACHQUC_07270 [Chlamydiales bacterium]
MAALAPTPRANLEDAVQSLKQHFAVDDPWNINLNKTTNEEIDFVANIMEAISKDAEFVRLCRLNKKTDDGTPITFDETKIRFTLAEKIAPLIECIGKENLEKLRLVLSSDYNNPKYQEAFEFCGRKEEKGGEFKNLWRIAASLIDFTIPRAIELNIDIDYVIAERSRVVTYLTGIRYTKSLSFGDLDAMVLTMLYHLRKKASV